MFVGSALAPCLRRSLRRWARPRGPAWGRAPSSASGCARSSAFAGSRPAAGEGGDSGSAAAELAVALPAVVLVLLLGVGVAGAGMRQVALQDTTSDAARLLGRGEGEGVASAVVRRVEPGAEVGVRRGDGLVCAIAHAEVSLAGRLVLPLRAEACALDGGR